MNEIVEAHPIEQRQNAPLALASSDPMVMLSSAISSGAGIDVIERLVALRTAMKKELAKEQFDSAFATFKAEAVKVGKGKTTSNGPLAGRKYAELYDWVSAVTPALSKHGLSSSWKITKDEKDWIEVTCFLRHQSGHEESVSMGGPPDTGGAKNALQARASTISYLSRYSLKAITGLAEQDDDADGNTEKEKPVQAKQPLTAKRFNDACESVRAGTYSVEKIKAQFELTPDQETALDDAAREGKK